MLLLSGSVLGFALSTAGCTSTGSKYETGTPVKIGLICLHDSNSTYDKNFIDSMDVAVSNLGDRVDGKAVVKTGVKEDRAAYDAAKDLVKQGCNVIFADSFGHEQFILEAAKEFPEVQFCHATGTKAKVANVSNYHNAFASIYEGRYLAGYAAGLKLQSMIDDKALTSKNYDENGNVKLGYVGAFPYAEVVSGYTSWYLGVKEVVNNVVMNVTFTSSWYDFNAERDGAKTLINWGAAIVSQHADSMGAPGECETNKVPNVTYNVSTATSCPTTYVAYSKVNWAPYYEAVVNAMYEGKGIASEVNNNYTGSISTGSVVYDCANVKAKEACDSIKAELENGTRKVFDCSKFTVGGKHITSYKADVDDFGDYAPDTEVIVTKNGITYFDESSFRSAPYFDLAIDGITKLNA